MQSKRKFDPRSPEIRAYSREVRLGSFTREGMMVAFPTCLPGVTTPIPHEESHITAMTVNPEGVVYGGTSGRKTHLFVANFHALSGIVFDIGMPEGAKQCAAVCLGKSKIMAFVNGPRGGRAISAKQVNVWEDLIQEWGFQRPALEDLGECFAGEPVVHAVADASGKIAVGVTTGHLFTSDLETPKIQVVGEVANGGRIAVASKGGVVGRDGDRHLWHFDPKAGTIRRRAVPLPTGNWDLPLMWARDGRNGLLYTADRDGNLFSFDEAQGFSAPLGRTHLAPVGPMAVTNDGRLFGFCGEEMANMFCYTPGRKEIPNLGVAVSVLERRRYGYVFGDAVTGKDGELLFGEDDNSGHMWLYFPKIQTTAA